LSAADGAVAVIPATAALAWKRRTFLLGDRACSFFGRHELGTDLLCPCEPQAFDRFLLQQIRNR
jgi:hypothetical protein